MYGHQCCNLRAGLALNQPAPQALPLAQGLPFGPQGDDWSRTGHAVITQKPMMTQPLTNDDLVVAD